VLFVSDNKNQDYDSSDNNKIGVSSSSNSLLLEKRASRLGLHIDEKCHNKAGLRYLEEVINLN
jgi:hypothetical protein